MPNNKRSQHDIEDSKLDNEEGITQTGSELEDSDEALEEGDQKVSNDIDDEVDELADEAEDEAREDAGFDSGAKGQPR